jgi:23S rRNA pseudouridine1911/1915/1917 synthase
LLKTGAIDLPGRASEASQRLRKGDIVTVRQAPTTDHAATSLLPEDIPLDVVFEDDDLLAINKQPGLVIHPAAGHRTGTLVHALLHRGTRLAAGADAERPGIVHRLDKDTSGLVLIAKTGLVQERLSRAFAERQVAKFYRALCWGKFRQATGDCRAPIGRHRIHRQKMTALKTGGRAASTDYRVLSQGALGADVECRLHTGRTHQIRVHLSHLGYPIWGDHLYGRPHLAPENFEPARQMLHAWRLEITHPMTGKLLKLEAPLPEDFKASRTRLLAG